MALSPLSRLACRLRCADRGALLVEFAIMLPLMILIFGVIVEGGRMMWSYQTAAAGVRDASRYLGRIVPSDLCDHLGVGDSLDGYRSGTSNDLKAVVELGETLAEIKKNPDETTTLVMPQQVFVNSVAVTLESCNTGLRVDSAAIVRVDATVQIQIPFHRMLEIMGGTFPATITTIITDRTRVFGA